MAEKEMREHRHKGEKANKPSRRHPNFDRRIKKEASYRDKITHFGKVKFFDDSKGFGFIRSLDGDAEYFVHESKLKTGIREDQIVFFEAIPSYKKAGQFDAVNVIGDIPVFIYKQDNSDAGSTAIVLHGKEPFKEFKLTSGASLGFYLVNLQQNTSSYTLNVIEQMTVMLEHAVGLLSYLLSSPSTVNASGLVGDEIRSKLPPSSIDSIYRSLSFLELGELQEIEKKIEVLNEFDFFRHLFARRARSFNKISFTFWLRGSLLCLPEPKSQNEVDIWRYGILPSLEWHELQEVILKLYAQVGLTRQVESSYRYLVKKGWRIATEQDLERAIPFIIKFQGIFPEVKLVESDFSIDNASAFVRLWQLGIIPEIANTTIREHISRLSTGKQKAEFIVKTLNKEALIYLSDFPELAEYKANYLRELIDEQFSNLDFLCFDLEVDFENIREFAWIDKTQLKSNSNYSSIDEGILNLTKSITCSGLVVGQNIKEFDLKILANYGLDVWPVKIWDTLEFEMLLNPVRLSYGLKTLHTAEADTTLTFQLFKSQVLRIALLDGKFEALRELLPSEIVQLILEIRNSEFFAHLDKLHFIQDANQFFRNSPTNKTIPESTFSKLQTVLETSWKAIIVAPELLWQSLSSNFSLDLYRGTEQPVFFFSEDRVYDALASNAFQRLLVLGYIESCKENGIKPYLEYLPEAIRLRLDEGELVKCLDIVKLASTGEFDNPICVSPSTLQEISAYVQSQRDCVIVIVGHELYYLTDKQQLGQDYDFAAVFAGLKNEPIWVQMSGGKSIIPIERHYCERLGIALFPPFMQNLWLEKVEKGKFRVFCNLNLEGLIAALNAKEVSSIPWAEKTEKKTEAYVLKPDGRRSYIAEQRRVNPESLNRSLYWVYQLKLFENVIDSKPKVLLVNDPGEVENLRLFARAKGYFIPDENASLARQVEILHLHRSTQKLIIIGLDKLTRLLNSNQEHSLDFVWESFLLQEKFQMLKGRMKIDLDLENLRREDDMLEGGVTPVDRYDVFSLIQSHSPLIEYYYKLIIDNNDRSRLFMCDPRLTDFYGIESSLSLNVLFVQMWEKEAQYEQDRAISSQYLRSAPQDVNTEFDLVEAKEVLRHIFLKDSEGSVPHMWRDYQDLCLNEILPANDDLLISLPTGAGKSLLFQGPSLFRAGFSSRLSIVIAPLRALMQDQVDSLWKKGFYSNVDYISGDKTQVEVKDIYRRIAGGEITLLYITPERFRSRSFENTLLTRLDADRGFEFVVFDEAHCISQWGQEFRPDYLNAGRKISELSTIYPCRKLLFSATISEQVFEEILQLMPGVQPVNGLEKSYNPVRDHIQINFKHNIGEEERLKEIGCYLRDGNFDPAKSRAIVFVKSRKKAEECAELMPEILKSAISNCDYADKVGTFHAGMDSEDRTETYERFKAGELVMLFATKAFGMGMDIPNIHFVTHYSPPSTFEDFLQEVGRAGRNEEQRAIAGYTSDNPISTFCLTSASDFASLKDQLHQSRISWHEVKEIKTILEKYVSKFTSLHKSGDTPVAVPLNLYSVEKGSFKDDLDTKFRVALHWLEKLERIRLGYLTITHLEVEAASLVGLADRLHLAPDVNSRKVCQAIQEIVTQWPIEGRIAQFAIASLRSSSRLSLENLFKSLLKLHSLEIIRLQQQVVIQPTKTRLVEVNYGRRTSYHKYPALSTIFSFAYNILDSVPAGSSVIFEGSQLDAMLEEAIENTIDFETLPWTERIGEKAHNEFLAYVKDIRKKRSKHAFTILRLLGKITHESKMEKIVDSRKQLLVHQSIFNGFKKKEEWRYKLRRFEENCIEVLDYVGKRYFEDNASSFNWADIINELGLEEKFQHLTDILFVLSVLGYSRTNGLLPSGIEVYSLNQAAILEEGVQAVDKKIFEEFEQTRKVRELKLIALEALAAFQKSGQGLDVSLLRSRQDTFIRKYFACNSLESLLQLLQEELPPNDPMLIKWRGDAIKTEEDRLNDEQRKVYDSEINQHINVMAGPGSGKTHTLTLRVARLVHYAGVPPEEILVLAYNRAVVSELKERLGKLFTALGYGNLAKRIKIYTFHSLAKRYCSADLKDRPFDEWEDTLLECLHDSPGQVMTNLGRLRFILVDEFQDINKVRLDLLQRLHHLTGAFLFIIGDPNQSIYGYERLNEEVGSMSPWPYYQNFDLTFKPAKYELYNNHRSYPDILSLASSVLELSPEHKHLIPRPTKIPDANFIAEYAQLLDWRVHKVNWWDKLAELLEEKHGDKQQPYKQIAVLFRTNNEVYKGFQRVKALNLRNVRVRIQGSLPYEFTRIRECHAVVLFLKENFGRPIPSSFDQEIDTFLQKLIKSNPNWNHFYIRVVHAVILEYLEEDNELPFFEDLLDFIEEVTRRDDGQLYKIYDKHIQKVGPGTDETEVVLTTMHKVKGLEYDAVIVPPSFANLPLKVEEGLEDVVLQEQLDEERRLAFVAYTRARYRLVVIKHDRENALDNNRSFVTSANANSNLGIAVQPEIRKLKIGWAATDWSFNKQRINEYILSSVKSGDFVNVKSRTVTSGYNPFTVYELVKDGKVIGELSRSSPVTGHSLVTGFVVNEVVVWTYEDTCRFDREHGENFGQNWCEEAKKKGYIYLVDFAGYGKVGN